GIVRIHLIEASELVNKDFQIGGLMAGKSDPYAILRVGTQVFTSRVINENLNPVWKEMYEAIVHEVPGQELEVELFDKDPDKDDDLGRMKLDLGEVKKAKVLDKWYELNGVKSGKIHLRLEWLTLMPNASNLEQVINMNKGITSKTNEEPSAAFLMVYLDRADDLPVSTRGGKHQFSAQFNIKGDTNAERCRTKRSAPPSSVIQSSVSARSGQSSLRLPASWVEDVGCRNEDYQGGLDARRGQSRSFCSTLKKSAKQPNPMVQLSIQDVTHESKTVFNTNSPVWEEPFRFFLRNPSLHDLDIQVKDDDRQQTLGTLSVPLGRILSADQLTLDQWFQLENSGQRSRIYLKLVMRILYLDPTVSPVTGSENSDVVESTHGSSVDRPPRSNKTSPPENFGTEYSNEDVQIL
ncbi:unnamed protein product, partial [Ranitomeya imitator]